MAHVIKHVDDQSFHLEVEMSRGAVLVEFVTPTCSACRQIEPWLQGLAQQLAGQLKIVKIDSTRARRVAQAFGIRMAPTLIVFRNGQPMQTIQGKPPTPNRLFSFVQPYL
jgi:thioredoxin 1